MGKLTGVLFILVGCAGLVASWSAAQKRRQSAAAELIRILFGWECSLQRERMRLSDFFARYADSPSAVGMLLAEFTEALETREYRSGEILWREVLKRHQADLDLGREMWELLLSADGVFFGTSSAESLRSARLCRAQMEECLARERAEHIKKQKVYAPLGLLGGVLIVILLI